MPTVAANITLKVGSSKRHHSNTKEKTKNR
jgi:hypothetical protein